jgi:hypothetical protein
MPTRRMILKTGVVAIVVAAAGGGLWVGTRTPTKALEPWSRAKAGYGDARLDALAYAILAPNPHNRQPWLVELVADDAFDLRCDLDRRLEHTDPYDRQITVGLGCFLELFRMAALAQGYTAQIDAFPDGEPHPRLDGRRAARVTLMKTPPQKDPLFGAVLDRRSNKGVYKNTPVDPAAFAKLMASSRVGGTLDPAAVAGLRELSFQAHELEMRTPRTMQESVDLMRFGKAEIEANPDGISMGGPTFELMNITGMMTRENVGDPTSLSFSEGLKIFHEKLYSAMGYVWVTSRGNSRTDQILAGKDWVRLNMRATKLGLAVHPLSQALQEYAEMDKSYTNLHRALGVKAPARVQMFARIGYGPETQPSPRWPLMTRLVNA